MSRPRAVLSVDLELFTHLPAYRNASGATDDSTIGLAAIEVLLNAFEAHDAAATFFTVSEVAERHPEAIARAADAAHEIGSHTHTHRHLSDLSTAERRGELERSRECLGRVTDAPIAGFRAPSFDTAPGHFAALAEAGYEYDASVAPCRSIPGWYGGEGDRQRPGPARAFDPDAPAGVAELPIAVMPGLRLPLTGTWLRFFGPRYTILGMRLLARQGIAPVLYVHPWEFVDLPAVEGVPKRVYYHTGAWMRRALDRILSAPFEFVTAATAIEDAGSTTRPITGSNDDSLDTAGGRRRG